MEEPASVPNGCSEAVEAVEPGEPVEAEAEAVGEADQHVTEVTEVTQDDVRVAEVPEVPPVEVSEDADEAQVAQPSDSEASESSPSESQPSEVDRGAPFVRSFQEFKEMGCRDAAYSVLRQGLQFCPTSPALNALAASEGIGQETDENGGGSIMEQLRRRELFMQQMHMAQQRQRMQQMQQWQASLQQPRYSPPPQLPEPQVRKPPARSCDLKFFDEQEYPDKTKASRGIKAIVLGAIAGIVVWFRASCPAHYFVWSFLACHLACIVLLRDYGGDYGLLAVCAGLAFHAGHSMADFLAWNLGGDDSLGPWAVVVVFACILYLQGFLKECNTLPPDYISTLSFFFPVFPAYDAAVAFSCLEFWLEWRYLPEFKLWRPLILLGVTCMAAGQALVIVAARTADRNFWASTREMEEDELVGLEIPNRKVVQEGPYAWERHPAYLGALLWGIGTQLALCNPVMLVMVAFVLWASLLHVTIEEEKELFDEFPGWYSNYTAVTSTWIPGFPEMLESSAFQREMEDTVPEDGAGVQEESEEEIMEEEDDLLPTWEGVKKGGALWNRQFQEPWRLG